MIYRQEIRWFTYVGKSNDLSISIIIFHRQFSLPISELIFRYHTFCRYREILNKCAFDTPYTKAQWVLKCSEHSSHDSLNVWWIDWMSISVIILKNINWTFIALAFDAPMKSWNMAIQNRPIPGWIRIKIKLSLETRLSCRAALSCFSLSVLDAEGSRGWFIFQRARWCQGSCYVVLSR